MILQLLSVNVLWRIILKENKYDYECPNCTEFVELEYHKDSKFPFMKLQGYCQNCHLDILISLKEYWNYLDENFLKTPIELLDKKGDEVR